MIYKYWYCGFPFGDNICERGILLTPFNSSTIPLISKFLVYLDTLQALVNPTVRVTQPTIVFVCLLKVEFRIRHLFLTGSVAKPQ